MPRSEPCLDCPFLRGADKLNLSDIDMFNLTFDHFTECGGYKEYTCEEQGDICFGQAQVIANGLKTGLDPESEIGQIVFGLDRNFKDYFQGPWEFSRYHER